MCIRDRAGVGALLAERGRVDEAREYLQKALVADPNLVAAKQKLDSLPIAAQVANVPATDQPASTAIQAGASELTPPQLGSPTIQR